MQPVLSEGGVPLWKYSSDLNTDYKISESIFYLGHILWKQFNQHTRSANESFCE